MFRILLGCLLFALPAYAEDQSAISASANQAWVQRMNQGTVGIITGGVDGTYIRIGTDLVNVLDDGDALRILPIIGKGSVQNIGDLLFLKGVDVAIVQSDVLAYAQSERLYPGIASSVQYITKLYNEEVHVLARPEYKQLSDLAGLPVNIDVKGSGSTMTASLLFKALGIKPVFTQYDQNAALTKLNAGELAAMVYVAGQPARLFSNIPADSGLHFISIPLSSQLDDLYLPGVLSHTSYPTLVPDSDTVATVSVGSVMAVYAWPTNTDRYRKVARLIDAMFTKFPLLLQPPRHPKWGQVDLLAEVPGWKRFQAASTWIKEHTPATDLARFLAQTPNIGLDQERLLSRFVDWQKHQNNQPIAQVVVIGRKPPPPEKR